MTTRSAFDRRDFLRTTMAVGAGMAVIAGPFGALGAQAAAAAKPGRPQRDGGYGPLSPVRDQTTGLPLLMLPKGFEYISSGWTSDPMSDGVPTPGSHDGMAAFRDGDRVQLVRNHELSGGASFAPAASTYNPAAAGGTTNLVFDPDAGQWLESYASLGGTIRNCAGGPTGRGTWLTCEETTDITADGTRHGYVFEVPANGVSDAVPLTAMGRFSHEAVAEDPATGFIYETEDAGSSALYRFRPVDRANLAAGGVLEAMVLDTTADTIGWVTGDSAGGHWVVVDQPDWGPGEPSAWQQARAKGAARISRGEGAWYGNGVIYIISTNGGPQRQGQVFAYDPANDTFTCIFASPSADVLNAPDNVCVSPRGGLVLCEDGSGLQFMHGLSVGGDIFPFAQNNTLLTEEFAASKGYNRVDYTGSEWCGATFEPKNGNWLFANVQQPGYTVAITGPWRKGAL